MFLTFRTEVFRWHSGVCRLFFKDTFLNGWKNTNKYCCNIVVVKTDNIQKVLRACFQRHFYSPAGALLLFHAKGWKIQLMIKKMRYCDRFVGFCLLVCFFLLIYLQITLYATWQKTCITSLALEPDIPVSLAPACIDAIWILGTFLSGLLE